MHVFYNTGKFTAPTVQLNQEELQVLEGERATLMVEASGCPQPTITWIHKEREMVDNYATELGEDGSLTLVCVEPRHAGIYHFIASNEAGSVEGSITLIVCTDEQQVEGDINLVTVESNPLEVEQFGEGVSRLHACNNAGFILQYQVHVNTLCRLPLNVESFFCTCAQSLPSGEADKNVAIGTSPANQLRNRFRNIVACELIGSPEE